MKIVYQHSGFLNCILIDWQTRVRDNVAATAAFEDILKRLDDESGSRYNHRVMWRYLATDNGMMRIYPAVELPKTYDATERQW